MNEDTPRKDAFIQMVTAKASVDLRLSDYHPRSMLVVPEHGVRRPKFPVIDYHNHLDAQDPRSVLRVMDECGVELIVNITMRVGREALDMIFKYQMAAPGRFATYGWMDWSDLQPPGFFPRTVDRFEDLGEEGPWGLKLWKALVPSIPDA